MPTELHADWLPVADLRPLAPGPWADPPAGASAALMASVRARGVLEPLLVRSPPLGYRVQAGSRDGASGYLILDTRLVRGATGYAGDPPFFPTRAAAERALPRAAAWEVVRGHGRLAAARACRLRLVPCVIRLELTDEDVMAVRGTIADRGDGILG